MNKLYSILIVFLIPLLSFSQQLDWFLQESGSITPADVLIDNNNNIYTLGTYTDSVDLDPGQGVHMAYANTVTIPFLNQTDRYTQIYIRKQDSSGQFVWARTLGSAYNYDQAGSISKDSKGDLIISGSFRDSVDFDPGTGIHQLTASNFEPNGFVLKLDDNGNFISVVKIGAFVRKTVVSENNNALILGTARGRFDANPSPTAQYWIGDSTNFNVYDFLIELDSTGSFSWARYFAPGRQFSNRDLIVLDSTYNIYIAGIFYGTIDADPTLTADSITAVGNYDCMITKLNKSGSYLWTKQFGSQGGNEFNDIAIEDGSLYGTGRFEQQIDFDPGTGTQQVTSNGWADGFFLKLDLNGSLIWANPFGGSSFDQGISITKKVDGNLVVGGTFRKQANFNPGTSTHILSRPGLLSDIFFTEYTPSGTIVDLNHIKVDSIGSSDLFDITIDQNNQLYVHAVIGGTYSLDLLPTAPNWLFLSGGFQIRYRYPNPIAVGIDQNELNNKLTVYPNPTNEFIQIISENQRLKEIQLLNSEGRLVAHQTPSESRSTFKIEGPNGLYFIRAIGDNSVETLKVIKQ